MHAMKTMGVLLWRTVLTALLTLVKMIIANALILPILLTILWRWLCRMLKKFNFKEIKEPKPCHLPFPEDVMRRPDPCLYSQFYLLEQNLPVTWDNPDIWISAAATPNVIEPDSYHLRANTHYLVHVQVHNASVDPALGVRVRLVYRPWSFNSPDLVPVETDANGNEVIRFVNVAGMGTVVTTFNWLTPNNPADGASSHWCLQAHLFHPMDTNPKNNLGQENTQVFNTMQARLHTTDIVTITADLFNHGDEARRYRIRALHYQPDEEATVELKLRSNKGKSIMNSTQKLKRLIPDINFGINRDRKIRLGPIEWFSDVVTIRNRYIGYERIKAQLQKTAFDLPEHLQLTVNDNQPAISLEGKGRTTLDLKIRNAKQHDTPVTYNVTLVAIDDRNIVSGGIHIQFTY